jgi:hypothetical protein
MRKSSDENQSLETFLVALYGSGLPDRLRQVFETVGEKP